MPSRRLLAHDRARGLALGVVADAQRGLAGLGDGFEQPYPAQLDQSSTLRRSICRKSASRVTSVAPNASAVAAIQQSLSSSAAPLRCRASFVSAYASPAAGGTASQGIAASTAVTFCSTTDRRLPGGESAQAEEHFAANDRAREHAIGGRQGCEARGHVRVLTDEVAGSVRVQKKIHASRGIVKVVEDTALTARQLSAFDGAFEVGQVLRRNVRRLPHGFEQAGRGPEGRAGVARLNVNVERLARRIGESLIQFDRFAPCRSSDSHSNLTCIIAAGCGDKRRRRGRGAEPPDRATIENE